ncbi:hypothetical protein BR93DRAFT_121507 [Coniochaeta sp. PMI_546]|nr:hypothetical protein BR93DRAFT_121507 [Coniochaeta sp. PMI_546]
MTSTCCTEPPVLLPSCRSLVCIRCIPHLALRIEIASLVAILLLNTGYLIYLYFSNLDCGQDSQISKSMSLSFFSIFPSLRFLRCRSTHKPSFYHVSPVHGRIRYQASCVIPRSPMASCRLATCYNTSSQHSYIQVSRLRRRSQWKWSALSSCT